MSCVVTSDPNGDNSRLFILGGIIQEEQGVEDFYLFPNPAKEKVTLKMPSSAVGEGEIVIFNMLGQQVKTYTFDYGQTRELTFNFKEIQLNNGFYTMQVRLNGNTKTFKVLYNAE